MFSLILFPSMYTIPGEGGKSLFLRLIQIVRACSLFSCVIWLIILWEATFYSSKRIQRLGFGMVATSDTFSCNNVIFARRSRSSGESSLRHSKNLQIDARILQHAPIWRCTHIYGQDTTSANGHLDSAETPFSIANHIPILGIP